MIGDAVMVRHPCPDWKHDQGEDRQQVNRAPRPSRIWWIQKELTATDAIRHIQTQPSVRWGKVPFGAANCTTPSRKAVMAAKAWRGIAGGASSNGARLMTSAPDLDLEPHK